VLPELADGLVLDRQEANEQIFGSNHILAPVVRFRLGSSEGLAGLRGNGPKVVNGSSILSLL
jgi:hypothetical protein